jgi:quinol monooxygenase YgiN
MLQGFPALLATLGALAATGLLSLRAKNERLPYLIAWCLTLAGVCVALAAMTLGFLLGFRGLLFRVMEAGGALVAPVFLALGMIVLIARPVPVRFAAWLFGASFSFVAVVILLLDPLKGDFTKALPDPGRNYDALPLLLIDVAHVVAIFALVACTAVTALRASKQDKAAYALLMPVALVALAGVLVVSGTRGFLPGVVAVLALAGAAGLIWFGTTRMLPAPQREESEEYGDQEFQDQHYGDRGSQQDMGYQEHGYQDQGYGRTGYDDLYADPAAPMPVPAQQAPAAGPPVGPPVGMAMDGQMRPAAGPLAPQHQPATAMCGQITVYTLMEGRGEVFDLAVAEAVRGAHAAEPNMVIFTCHEVANAPTQRIVYQLFRDQAAFEEHQRQPHVQRFLLDSRPYVLATNVIELKLGAAKVPGLPPALTGQDYR